MKSSRGFTLIEMLVVIAILSLLLTLGATQFSKFLGKGKEAQTIATVEQLKALLEEYRNETSDYPPSRLAAYGIKSRNDLNEGIEALVVGLFHKDYAGRRFDDEGRMTNGDGDSADKNVTTHAKPVLLEVIDAWENPLVYFRYDDYSRTQEYEFMDGDTMEIESHSVAAAQSELTGGYQKKESYQLVSVGEDGKYGTEDDITSF